MSDQIKKMITAHKFSISVRSGKCLFIG